MREDKNTEDQLRESQKMFHLSFDIIKVANTPGSHSIMECEAIMDLGKIFADCKEDTSAKTHYQSAVDGFEYLAGPKIVDFLRALKKLGAVFTKTEDHKRDLEATEELTLTALSRFEEIHTAVKL
jgi:hypothetical protein